MRAALTGPQERLQEDNGVRKAPRVSAWILDQFVPYKRGRIPRVREDGRLPHKLSSNESPFGPLHSVVEVIAAAAGQVNR